MPLIWKLYVVYGAGYGVKDHNGKTVVYNLSSADAKEEALQLAKNLGLDVKIVRDESEDE